MSLSDLSPELKDAIAMNLPPPDLAAFRGLTKSTQAACKTSVSQADHHIRWWCANGPEPVEDLFNRACSAGALEHKDWRRILEAAGEANSFRLIREVQQRRKAGCACPDPATMKLLVDMWVDTADNADNYARKFEYDDEVRTALCVATAFGLHACMRKILDTCSPSMHDLNDALQTACSNGDVVAVCMLFPKFIEFEPYLYQLRNLLNTAIDGGHEDVVAILVKDTEFKKQLLDGDFAQRIESLRRAIAKGHASIVRTLAEALGGQLRFIEKYNTAILAVKAFVDAPQLDWTVLCTLIETTAFADIAVKPDYLAYGVNIAAQANNALAVEALTKLIDGRVDSTTILIQGLTGACEGGHLALASMFEASLSAATRAWSTAIMQHGVSHLLHYASQGGNAAVVRLMLDSPLNRFYQGYSMDGGLQQAYDSALNTACLNKNMEVIKTMLEWRHDGVRVKDINQNATWEIQKLLRRRAAADAARA